MELTIVPSYAAVLGIGMIILSLRVIRIRRMAKIAVGDRGEPVLERAIRVHGNFSEYVPLAIILLAFVEISGSPGWLVHGLCGLLVAGRAIHAFGVSRTAEDYRFRTFGMVATLAVLGVTSSILLTGGSLVVRAFG